MHLILVKPQATIYMLGKSVSACLSLLASPMLVIIVLVIEIKKVGLACLPLLALSLTVCLV